MKYLTETLEGYSFKKLLVRRTIQSRLAYLLSWIITSFVYYLFYSVLALSAMAGLILFLNLIIQLWQ